jgi:hypothetical protein
MLWMVGSGPVSEKPTSRALSDLRWAGSLVDYFRIADQPSTIWPTPLKSRSTRADEAQDFVRPESGSGRYCFNPAAPFSTRVMGEPASSPTGTSRRKRWPIPLPTHFGAEATVIDG